MNKEDVLQELAGYGNENTKRVLVKHGAREPFFGVKVQDLKKIQKKIKKNHKLSLELYATGNSDAMYLAGLIADEKQMTPDILNNWVKEAYWYMISEYTVAWIAAESDYGFTLGQEWIQSKQENIACAGWSTLTSVTSIKPDEELDLETYRKLLNLVGDVIHQSPNRVRYTMNGFVIAVACFVAPLTNHAIEIATKIGKVKVEMGGTACKVPLATDYIQKVIDKNRIGKKKKKARC